MIRKSHFLTLILASLVTAFSLQPGLADDAKKAPAAPAPAKPDPATLYAVIEIGGSGVKPSLFTRNGTTIKFIKDKKYEPVEGNAFSLSASSSGLVAGIVGDCIKVMQSEYQLPDGHALVVGSSGVPRDIRDNLSDTIRKQLKIKMEFISVEEESTLEFQNLVPQDQYKNVVLLDIGSGNSKGSYADVRDAGTRLVSFSIPFGAKTFAQEVDDQRKDGAFLVTAESLRQELILPQVRDNVEISPGMQRKKTIYIVGGIPWAMTTLLHPFETKATLVQLKPEEIDAFLKKAIQSPHSVLQVDLASAPHQPTDNADKAREDANKDISRIGSIYTDNQLVAGAIVLKTFLEEMQYQDKDVYFNSQALYAWPQQYIINHTAQGK